MRRLFPWMLVLAGAAWGAIRLGVVPAPADVVAWLASQPELRETFADPTSARTDALVFMIGLVFFGPVLVLVAAYALAFVHEALKQLVLPLVRAAGLPEATAGGAVVLAIGVLLATQHGLWLPRSLWFLGLVVRATRTALA